MKEKILDFLYSTGSVLYVILCIIVSIMPVVAINIDGFFINALFFLIMQLFPPSAIIFWIWGLIKVMGDVQDWFAITYYVATFVLFVPQFVFSIIRLSANIVGSRKSGTPKKSKHFGRNRRYKKNSKNLLKTCLFFIRKYEMPLHVMCEININLLCEADIIRVAEKKALEFEEEIIQLENNDIYGGYLEIAHKVLINATFDLISSDEYYKKHTAPESSITDHELHELYRNLVTVYKKSVQWGIETGIIDEEAREEQIEILLSCPSTEGIFLYN